MSRQTETLARIERFNRRHGGGVSAFYRQGGYTLTVAETGAPVARLRPTGRGDTMRVYYWSHRETWADAGPLGSMILPLDDALKTIASEPVVLGLGLIGSSGPAQQRWVLGKVELSDPVRRGRGSLAGARAAQRAVTRRAKLQAGRPPGRTAGRRALVNRARSQR